MPDHTEFIDIARVQTLEAEVRTLRQRLVQREELLKVLNRRLLQLERGESGLSGMDRAEVGLLQEQLESLRNTKLFRWSSPIRDVYSRMRIRK